MKYEIKVSEISTVINKVWWEVEADSEVEAEQLLRYKYTQEHAIDKVNMLDSDVIEECDFCIGDILYIEKIS